jgi:hypothetical protein
MSHAMACIIGISFRSEVCNNIYIEYLKAAKDGMFKGSWSNENQEVSTDNRVLGSRHDQTCLGFIANKLSLNYRIDNCEYAHSDIPPQTDVPFYTCADKLTYQI